MGRHSKKAEATGAQSIIDAEREYKKYLKILEIAMNPDEFQKIWDGAPPAVKLNYTAYCLKYVFKEKGKETESNTNAVNDKLDELNEKIQALNKLMNT